MMIISCYNRRLEEVIIMKEYNQHKNYYKFYYDDNTEYII